MKKRTRWPGMALSATVVFFVIALAAQQTTPREIPLGIVVVASEGSAQAILKRLNAGEDFASVARKESTDPSATDGGYLGLMDPRALRPELQAALDGTRPGEIAGVVKIPAGYAILKVLKAAPAAGSDIPPTGRQSLSAAGAVRVTYDYAGFAAALRAVDKFDKPQGWDRDLHQACEVRTQAIPAVFAQLEPLLTRPGTSPALLRDINSLLGDLHSYRGDLEDVIRYREASYKLALANSPDRVPQIEESLGVAWLQAAGNTLYARYVFPKPVIGVLSPEEKSALARAATYFLSYLKHDPADGEVRWLLNLTYMLAGEYPAKVPKEFVIPPAVFQSSEEAVHLQDVAHEAGLARRGQAGGLIVDDFDNDGFLDLMISDVNDCEPLAFYHNNGDGTFTNRAAQAGLSDQTGGLNIVQTDYNNDGCKDILVLRGGWEYPRRKSLLRNNCDGTFTDVTASSGLGDAVTSTQTGVWIDIDNDGYLDLFIGNESAPGQLYLNKGDGTFSDISASAGIDATGFTKGVAAADYDNDGYMDLYVSAYNGEHHLFHNNRNRTFTDVTREAGVEGPWTSFGAWFFDYDNDGWADLFVAGYGVSVEDVMRGYLKQPQGGETLRLFRNLGNGKFRDVTAETGLKRVFMPMGLNFGDIDNDGFLDFYLGSGNPSWASPIPNVLFHNQQGRRFSDITVSSGTGVLPKGHGTAFADLDNDGDEDLFIVMGGAVPSDKQTAHLFENPGNGNDWLSVRLIGSKSNRAAVGARIEAEVSDAGSAPRSIFRTVGSGGSFGAGPFEQHIGLGKSAVIRSLEIWWPATNARQTFHAVQKNRFIEIREGENEIHTVQRRSFRLGGAKRL